MNDLVTTIGLSVNLALYVCVLLKEIMFICILAPFAIIALILDMLFDTRYTIDLRWVTALCSGWKTIESQVATLVCTVLFVWFLARAKE
jgi:hypothetical protein